MDELLRYPARGRGLTGGPRRKAEPDRDEGPARPDPQGRQSALRCAALRRPPPALRLPTQLGSVQSDEVLKQLVMHDRPPFEIEAAALIFTPPSSFTHT
jgi:hypothetical protein